MRLFLAIGLVMTVLLGCAATAGPQPLLPRSSLTIDTPHGPVRFAVEMAVDARSQQTGLMFRTAMAPDAGMLFDFHRKLFVAFWMKDTILPLDLIFIRADGTISTITANAVPYSTRKIVSAEPIRAVLEINAGLAESLGIEPMARVHHAIFGNAPGG